VAAWDVAGHDYLAVGAHVVSHACIRERISQAAANR